MKNFPLTHFRKYRRPLNSGFEVASEINIIYTFFYILYIDRFFPMNYRIYRESRL